MMSNDRIASLIEDLAKRCRDSEVGYRTAAEATRDQELAQQFRQLSGERSGMADELDQLIRKYGGQPPAASGTALGAAHRMFTDLRSALSRDDRHAVLAEVARGESAAEESYDAYKTEDLPQDVRDILKRHHDRVRATRDRYRQMSGQMHSGASVVAAAWQGPQAVGRMVGERPVLSSAMAFLLGFAAGAAVAGVFGRSNAWSSSNWGHTSSAGRGQPTRHSYRY